MRKVMLTGLLSTAVLLGACSDGEDENTNGDNGNTNNEQEETNDNGDNNASNEEDDLTAEEIMEEVIALYNGLEGLYVEAEGSGDVSFEMPEDEEEIGDAEMDLNTSSKEWNFMQDGMIYNRSEVMIAIGVEEEGGETAEEETTTISFTDIDDPNYAITYEEGDEEAVRYEDEITQDFTFSMMAEPYQDVLDNGSLTLVGEEEINGYQTYNVEAEQDGETMSFWIDQETFFPIKETMKESNEGETVEGSVEAEDTVIDFELNPTFDESAFVAPDDLTVEDGELADTIQ
ncbi:hypothetical protein JOC54_000303 [Alkalihalobacillus xiaoxiensis]|uniref:Outer membrane lipoprotein-sorting protein n=1 Tax=Shouchella xiaoxiensis TaxID=766895 RepID=A0ABS2SS25_9BACI|nr:hypothetical protein [Shouchella xiaoxiensis]MBM7837072.1 hypothetical protein [Shouchella xiaoxiensis]